MGRAGVRKGGKEEEGHVPRLRAHERGDGERAAEQRQARRAARVLAERGAEPRHQQDLRGDGDRRRRRLRRRDLGLAVPEKARGEEGVRRDGQRDRPRGDQRGPARQWLRELRRGRRGRHLRRVGPGRRLSDFIKAAEAYIHSSAYFLSVTFYGPY